MADNNTTQTAVVTDPNKTPEQYIAEAEKVYIVPKLVRDKFGDLVKLIFETESMNAEEREYWMQILPIMTEEQIVKFRNILVNEKVQLSKLDSEYQNEMGKINSKHVSELSEAEMKLRLKNIKEQEVAEEKSEKSEEENLLNKLQDL